MSETFGSLNVSEAIPRPKLGRVVTVPPNASLREALDIMLCNRVRSAPVIEEQEGGKSIRLIEISDILKIIVDTFSEDDSYIENDVMYILQSTTRKEWKQPTALDVSNISNNASFIIVAEGSSLLDVATAMGFEGVRRVLVVDSLGDLTNIVTQTTVLELLVKHRDEMGSFLDKTLFELELGSKKIISVGSSERALEAFRKIVENHISAVAIVDDVSNELIGSINVHDVESIAQEGQTIKRLFQRADQFIESTEFVHDVTVRCSPLSTVNEVINMMTENNAHRVWICTKKNMPLGIITITDLLRATVMTTPDNTSSLDNYSE